MKPLLQFSFSVTLTLFLALTQSACFDSKSKEVYQNLGNEKRLRLTIPLKDGLPNGVVKAYTTQGEVFAEQNYLNGLKDGKGHVNIGAATNHESFEFNYSHGLLNGQIVHQKDGKQVHEEAYLNGLPTDWDKVYQSPFNPRIVGKTIEIQSVERLYCGWIEYSDDQVHSDAIEFEKNGSTIKVERLYSVAFNFEPNLFEAVDSGTPDANGFTSFHFVKGIYPNREGELKLRLYSDQGKTHLQGYGYLKVKPIAVTAEMLQEDATKLLPTFNLRHEADLVDREGFQKIELNCNNREIEDRTDYSKNAGEEE